MLSLLKDYIPYRCEREAAQTLFRAALDQGFELTSKAVRQQYENVMLQSMLQAMPLVTVPSQSIQQNAD